jgi:hypothetical protein
MSDPFFDADRDSGRYPAKGDELDTPLTRHFPKSSNSFSSYAALRASHKQLESALKAANDRLEEALKNEEHYRRAYRDMIPPPGGYAPTD